MCNSRPVLGCIGFGNMGRALMLGVWRHPELRKQYAPLVYDADSASRETAREAGLSVAPNAPDLARDSDIILLAVKPHQVGEVLRAIAPALALAHNPEKLLISLAAGVRLGSLKRESNSHCPVMRVMPNTPVLVGQGIFGLCFEEGVSTEQREEARRLFSCLGQAIEIPESKMNAFTALAGSGPGYIFHFMESLVEAGVSAGLDRPGAEAIVLSLLKGCAAMSEKTGLHPAVLREQVSSPAGMTIAALNHLDRCGARGQLVDAVLAAMARGKAMEEE